MKAYISIDIEGISGVFHPTQSDDLWQPAWVDACRHMQADLDVAVQGCNDAGADEIVICDAHYMSNNLDFAVLPDNASLVRTAPVAPLGLAMLEGIDDSFDAVLFVGYHAKQGTQGAVLCHSYVEVATSVVVLTPDGAETYVTGEIGMNAATAGVFGVPVVFVSGDDKTCQEAKELIPGVEVVATKEGLGRSAARLYAPGPVRREIRAAVKRALTAETRPAPIDWEGRVLRVSYADTRKCDMASACPTVKRLDGLTIEIAGPDYLAVLKTFFATVMLALEGNH
jgi:D-amino peptidase